MLKINFDNFMADAIGDKNGITKNDIADLTSLSGEAHDQLNDWRKSEDAIFFDTVFDDNILGDMQEKAQQISSTFDNIIVLGIGGSSLGLRCLQQALLKPYWNLLDRKQRNNLPRLFVCDNIDPDTFSSLMNLVDVKKTCFIIISKSGRTTETASQFFIVM